MVFLLMAALSLVVPRLAAQETVSALRALLLLPKSDMKNIVRIEARDGTPAPERWYLIVHDPDDANGLHEFVVAGKEIVASRAISQFVEAVKPEEVMNPDTIKIDSDDAVKIAKEYAAANKISMRSINYELKKDGAESSPVWKISCLDETGNSVAELMLTATKGTVVSHLGFASAPQPQPEKKKKLKASAPSEVKQPPPEKKKKPKVAAAPEVAPPNPPEEIIAEPPQQDTTPERQSGIGQKFKDVGNSFKRFFTGHE